VAAQVQRAFNDGVWLVELGQLRDPALLAHTMANTLGLRDSLGCPPTAKLVEYLASRRLLLVLDGCEHLIDAVASMVEALLRSCPELRILATSREPLSISGEATLPVPPLPTPDPNLPHALRALSDYDAVALFTQRAMTMTPDFTLSTRNHTAVAQICHRLDGLPLAIELATARLHTLSVAEILHRLSNQYQLLAGGRAGAPTRQQTLQACIEWSYDLCTISEQLLWNRMAVFTGGFELDAAEDICAGRDLPADDLVDVVASLVDKSILIPDEHGTVVRYRLLGTIRDHGRAKLRQTNQDTALRRRHRDWYEQLARHAEVDWISSRQVTWLARFDRELPNIRAVLEFCLTEPGEAAAGLRIATALFPYWARGRLSEGRLWLEVALARQNPPTTTSQAKALYCAAVLAGLQGDSAAASDHVEELAGLADQLGDAESRTLATHAGAVLAIFISDLPRAVAGFEQVVGAHRVRGNLSRLLEALIGLAYASGLLGDTARATAAHEEILAITESRGELWYRSHSLHFLGIAEWLRGNSRRAIELVEQCLRLNRLTRELLGTGWNLQTVAWIAAEQHDPRRAAKLLGAAESLSRSMGIPTATFPNLLAHHRQCDRQARCQLGNQAFEVAFQQGLALSFEDAIAYALNEKPQTTPSLDDTETTLTRRERQVASLIAEGLTNKEIAARLVIAQRTAEAHVERILSKLGRTTRTQIALWITQRSTNCRTTDIHQ
jgi:predicted ATPase/DNA-binding CsgD family transcriptional regulator